MKYKIGTLLSLDMNRIMFDKSGKAHSCESGDLFLIVDKDSSDTEYTVVSMNGFYYDYSYQSVKTIFRVIDV